jgi:carboxyl-terminal processing protease
MWRVSARRRQKDLQIMSRWNLSWLLGLSAAALVGLSLTYSAPSRERNLQKKHENLRLLVDVLEEVQQRYVKDLDGDKMRDLVENMINGGLEKLDPHSGFINNDEFKQFQHQNKGKFGGVGIRIRVEERSGLFLVESPMPGTPAYNAGVMAGDLIVKVDGKATEQQPLKKVVELIQGEPGTDVTLTVLHEGQKKPVDMKLTRAEIKVESVLGDQRHKDDQQKWEFWIDPATRIAYIRLVAFTETTVDELTRTVDSLQRAGMRGLVLDLRNNPGGLLRAAVDVSSMFLAEGKTVVTTKGRNNTTEEAYKAQQKNPNVRPGTYYPITILLNRYSASASEIVAAALQDHARAVIVGERSYGKGSVQNIIPMESGTSALKLTTASYWRPSERNIHRFPDSKEEEEWGVKPNKDYEVKLSDEERIDYYKWRRKRDVIHRPGEPAPKEEADKDGEAPDKDRKAEKKKGPFRDRVLDKAIEYIRAELQKQPAQDAAIPAEVAPAARLVSQPLLGTRTEQQVVQQDRSTRRVQR